MSICRPSRDRQRMVVVGDAGGWRDARRDRPGAIQACERGAGAARRRRALPGGRRRDDARGRSTRARRRRFRSWSSRPTADRPISFQARRDAGLHAGRLQHRQLPRRGPRQRRLPAVAVRLRPRRRPLPADPRDERPPRQPGAAAGEPADREVDRRRAAHRRQAVRRRQRILPDAHALARSGRPERRRPKSPRSRASNSIPSRSCSKAKGPRSS